ncbi:gonadal somatic cell derived factor [Antennarius striatus]|uniref:gonadal somatic cell derived factor n=1 Tax=Antennarius striatus TaxID=241820 RepID=UPI0035B2363C
MSFTYTVMMALLGSSVALAFVLRPSKEEPAHAPASHRRCEGGSLQSIRKSLLASLRLQVEPQLPAGGLDAIREQWRSTFSSIRHVLVDAAAPAASGSADGGNTTGLRCCSLDSQVFMKDLGWDSWVVYPDSLTITQCALCDPEVTPVQCPASHSHAQDAGSQRPCCQPTSQKMVPVVHVDESHTVFISSVYLTASCGCGHGDE